MSALNSSLLHDPAPAGIRTVGRELVARVRAAQALLDDPENPEALHDFRVAIRRLRSWLRTFRGPLGGDRLRRAERGLRRVARATNAARDAEVFARWLDEARDGLTARQKVGAKWLRQEG